MAKAIQCDRCYELEAGKGTTLWGHFKKADITEGYSTKVLCIECAKLYWNMMEAYWHGESD